MQVFHSTNAADAILLNGFRDSIGTYLTSREFSGVWVADRPLDGNEGVSGHDVVLCLEIPEELISQYEWDEGEVKGYREFLVPAELLNRFGPPRVYVE